MVLKYNIEIDKDAIQANLKRLTNQIYKLLPNREEGIDWKSPLTTIIEEIGGMNRLLLDHHILLFSLLCKLEGLFLLDTNKDYFVFRKTIFECLNLIGKLIQSCQ